MSDDQPTVKTTQLFGTAIGAGLTAAVVSVVVWLLATWLGVPDEVATAGNDPEPLGWVPIVIITLASALGAAMVARIIAGLGLARRVFAITALVVLAVSFAPLVMQPDDVAGSTRLVLGFLHVIVYLGIAGPVGRQVPD